MYLIMSNVIGWFESSNLFRFAYIQGLLEFSTAVPLNKLYDLLLVLYGRCCDRSFENLFQLFK